MFIYVFEIPTEKPELVRASFPIKKKKMYAGPK